MDVVRRDPLKCAPIQEECVLFPYSFAKSLRGAPRQRLEGTQMPKLADTKAPVVFASAKPKDKPYLIADGKGLGLLVTPEGTKRNTV